MVELKKIYLLLFIYSWVLITNSCVPNDEYAIPPTNCMEKWTVTKTISQIIAYNSTSTIPYKITDDAVFEAYVVSSDENGNFYKTISLQDNPKTPSIGIQLELNTNDLYTKFPVGKRVLVNAKNLYLAKDAGVLKLGQIYDYNGVKRVGRLDEILLKNHINIGCGEVITPIAKTFTNISDLKNEKNINTLIKLENIQFKTTDIGLKYGNGTASETAYGAVDRTLIDADGNSIILRTSTYASFANSIIPNKNGTITAVLSKYNNTYQLILRTIDDIQLIKKLPFVIFSENFETLSATQIGNNKYINLTGWTNVSVNNGTEIWEGAGFNNNKYAKVSAYGTGENNMETWLITPMIDLDNTNSEKLSFQTLDGYNKGVGLSVYISTNFTGNVKNAIWTRLNAAIASGSTAGYASSFTNSGDLDLSSYKGKVVIGFKYNGQSNNISTTYELDNVKVIAE